MGIDYLTLGLQHPFVVPHHLLMLLGLGVYWGFTASSIGKGVFWPVMAGLLSGLIATQFYLLKWETPLALLSVAFISGLLTAMRFKLPDGMLILVGLVGAWLVGFDSAPLRIPGISGWKVAQGLAGTWLSGSAIFVLAVLLAYGLRHVINGIIIRVFGSWIAAASSMVLALLVAGHLNMVK